MSELTNFTTHRRGFLGRVAAAAAACSLGGLGSLVAPTASAAAAREPEAAPHPTPSPNAEFEAWLNKIAGKHKMLFDVPEPHEGLAFAWARAFLDTTNEAYGTTDAQNSVVIVLRHSGIPYGIHTPMWAKDKFGAAFKIDDPATKKRAVRHPLINLKPGDAPRPGLARDEPTSTRVLV